MGFGFRLYRISISVRERAPKEEWQCVWRDFWQSLNLLILILEYIFLKQWNGMWIYYKNYINLKDSFISGINGADDSYRQYSHMTISKSLGNYCSGVKILIRKEHYKISMFLLAHLFNKLRIYQYHIQFKYLILQKKQNKILSSIHINNQCQLFSINLLITSANLLLFKRFLQYFFLISKKYS